MKTLAALALLLLAAPAFAQDVADPALRAELVERLAAEQDVRMRLIAAGFPASLDSTLMAEMAAVDAENQARVVEVVDAHGWPTPALVGADGASAAFFIVQHAAPDVQERMLPLVEAAYHAGDLPGDQYALLLDRVLVPAASPRSTAPSPTWPPTAPSPSPRPSTTRRWTPAAPRSASRRWRPTWRCWRRCTTPPTSSAPRPPRCAHGGPEAGDGKGGCG